MQRFNLALLLLAATLVGCTRTAAPTFRLNMPVMVANRVTVEQQKEIAAILEAMFGTPDKPSVLSESGLDQTKITLAAGPVWSDSHGQSRGLYRQHCVHCHGISGDAMGPTSIVLNPYPRDYRPGKYKFKSTERSAMPTHDDLVRVLRNGVIGTSMPSFDLLAAAEIDALVEYVKYLSLRGQTEIALVTAMADLGEGEKLSTERAFLVGEIMQPEAEKWATAKDQIIAPPPHPDMPLEDSIAAGRELFYGAKANCVKCHGPSGLGDGQQTDYDDWNKPLVELAKSAKETRNSAGGEMEAKERAAELAWVASAETVLGNSLPTRNIIPRNLRQGLYRGGRRPLDLYRRIHAGINGAPMPGADDNTLTPEQKWNVVDYVRSLPYESLSKPPRDTKLAGTGNL